jgi:hypothetical protein
MMAITIMEKKTPGARRLDALEKFDALQMSVEKLFVALSDDAVDVFMARPSTRKRARQIENVPVARERWDILRTAQQGRV